MIEKIITYIKHPTKIFVFLQNRCNFMVLPDKIYLRIRYWLELGKMPDLDDPKTFTEKLQWLKLHDKRPEYTIMVDKYAAKQYIADIIGPEYVVPTLGIWERFEDIDFNTLPDKFVLKCTHDSGGLVICTDKAKLDLAKAEQKIRRSLKRNYYWNGREWPYRDVPPRIIAEPYLEDSSNTKEDQQERNLLKDYKFFCFNGNPKVMYIAQELSEKQENDYFDMEFAHLPLQMNDEMNALVMPAKPKCFEKMKEIAGILSQGIPHVRVDFYCIEDHPYVGELTFFHDSGICTINPPEWDLKMGSWIDLTQCPD